MPSLTGLTIKPLAPLAAAIRQLYQPPKDTISGMDSTDWPSPLQPVKPIAPAGAEPLGWPFFHGQNQIYTPRQDAEYSAAGLRDLSQYDLVRVIIENTKDQICRVPWAVQLKPKPGESNKDRKKRAEKDQNVSKLSALFEFPNSDQNWSEWLRPLLEDLFVIDAPSILMRKTNKGDLAELRTVPGDSIVRYIDDNGFTPQPPDPAYAQLWQGIPRVNLTTDQLVYKPRNICPRNTVASFLYGYSPVEQAATWIKIGTERLQFQLKYYTDGSIPGVIHVVPPNVSPDKIAEAMTWMNSNLAGNLAARQQWRMIQGFQSEGKPDQVIFAKEKLLSDPFDDLIIRCLCFAFGTSPQRLMRMMNRASAQANQEAAEEEGLLPWLDWLKGTIDFIIQRKMGLTDYEIAFNPYTELDIKKQADADASDVKFAIRTINEVREDRGLDPSPEPEANQLVVITATGAVPLKGAQDARDAAIATQQTTAKGSNKPNGKGGNPDDEPASAVSSKVVKPNGHGNGAVNRAVGFTAPISVPPVTYRELGIEPSVRFEKVSPDLRIDPDNEGSKTSLARQRLEKTLSKFLERAGKDCAAAVAKLNKLSKRDEDEQKKYMASGWHEVWEAAVDAIAWRELVDEVENDLEQSALDGGHIGISQINLTSDDMISSVNTIARDYAEDRAAEMVGMKWVDGKLVDNPDAKWAISETTREELKQIVKQAFESETPITELTTAIRESGQFSQARAEMIARTETMAAQVRGNYDVWVKSGVVQSVKWMVSNEGPCDICAENEDQEVEIGKEFATGDIMPPAHPNCRCVLVAVKIKGVN